MAEQRVRQFGTVSAQKEVVYHIPESTRMLYANDVLVHGRDDEVIVSFFQLILPIAQSQEQFDAIKHLNAVCVARIALTPRNARALMETLRGTIEGRPSGERPEGSE